MNRANRHLATGRSRSGTHRFAHPGMNFCLRKLKRMTGLLLGLFLLSACGFHLRGLMNFPSSFQQVYLNAQHVHPEMVRMLTARLESYRITPIAQPKQAHYFIILEQEVMQQTLTNVSASTTPRQYQLVYQLQFQVTQRNGEEILPSQMIRVERQVTINNNRILGSNFEMQTIEHEMRNEAATQLLSRISLHLSS